MVSFVALVAGVAALLLLWRLGILGKRRLPELPESGPLPLAALPHYYELDDPPLAWERVRAWKLDERPAATASIDHAILTTRAVAFCSGKSGRLTTLFDLSVAAIERVTFEPIGLRAHLCAPEEGLVTIITPAGAARLIATRNFLVVLENAMAASKGATSLPARASRDAPRRSYTR